MRVFNQVVNSKVAHSLTFEWGSSLGVRVDT